MSESDLSQAWKEYLQGYGDEPGYPMGPEPKSNRPDPTKKYTIDELLKEKPKGGKTRRSRRKHRKSKRRHTRKH